MNNNSGSNIVAALKQKMADTREEVSRFKDKIQDLENSIQVSLGYFNFILTPVVHTTPLHLSFHSYLLSVFNL